MRNAIILMLNGMGSVDSGVETVLNEDAYKGFIDLIRSVYGGYVANKVKDCFKHDGGAYTCVMEDAASIFDEIS